MNYRPDRSSTELKLAGSGGGSSVDGMMRPSSSELIALTGLEGARSRRVHLVSQVGYQDWDILSHLLAYYRAVGVDDIHLVLHGTWWQRRVLASVCCGFD